MKRVVPAEAEPFITSHEAAVLSTLSRDNKVEGVTIYYRYINGNFYILTKADSSKAHNMLAHHQVALTIFDLDEIKTLQLQGKASIEGDMETKRFIFDELVRPRQYQGESLTPPVTQLHNGSFIVFRITPTKAFYTDYNEKSKLIPMHGNNS
ncbi:MAG TPA: pyridoxamine 5'-phosphate oxidase family protein [Candidatus Saccharimonadales bacterium]|nr:pyridoxamine 5'-phosphate oxidase family protein [Candidatus Saccharimonadales bacterium]